MSAREPAPRAFPPPELHFSDAKRLARSPAHFREGFFEDKGESPEMRWGVLLHFLLLGGVEPVVWTHGERRGNAWKEFKEVHAGETIVSKEELAEAERCAAVVRAHPVAWPFLQGERELPLKWRRGGRRCAGRIDVLGARRVVELKSTSNAEAGWFAYHAERMLYPEQVSWYADGARAAGYDVDEGFIVAVESQAPFGISVFRMSERALAVAGKTVDGWLARLRECETANAWPCYPAEVIDMEPGTLRRPLFDAEIAA